MASRLAQGKQVPNQALSILVEGLLMVPLSLSHWAQSNNTLAYTVCLISNKCAGAP